MGESLTIWPRPKWGAYCLLCRAYLRPERLLPLKGKRKVAPESKWMLGEDVGRCPFHAAHAASFVANDAAAVAEWHQARAAHGGDADARP
jgi:hypothetical protein